MLCPCSCGRVREGEGREQGDGKGLPWLLSWLVLAEGAPGHSMCPGWSQHTQAPGSIQNSLVSSSWLSMPQLCDYAGAFTVVSQGCLFPANCFPAHINSSGHLWYTKGMKIEASRKKSKSPTYCKRGQMSLGNRIKILKRG